MQTQEIKRVLVNSLPKSGTHLLIKAIEVLGYQEHYAELGYVSGIPRMITGIRIKSILEEEQESHNSEENGEKICVGFLFQFDTPVSILRQWLEVIPQKRYIKGHIPWTSKLSPLLDKCNYRQVVIIRDPRAVIASRMAYTLDVGSGKDLFTDGRHPLEFDFKLMSPRQRLDFILEGGYAPQAGVEIKNFAELYRSILAWRNDPSCLVVRFEDLVGEQGGGSVEKQRYVMESIASHLGIPFNNKISANMEKIYDPSSPTFKTGKIDRWKSSMNAENIELLMEYCDPLCKEAGYQV